MSGSALTTGDRSLTLENVADATTAPVRTRWRDAELELIAERDCERRGVKRIQKNRLLNVRRVGAVLRKLDAAGGNGTATTVQLARHLYADVGDAWDAGDRDLAFELAMNKRESIRTWLRVYADLGVITYEVLPGKSRGFRWRFCPVPDEVAILAESRGCSSVGSSDSRRDGRKPLRASQDPSKRVRRWCPRAGRGASYEPPRAPRRFFWTPEFRAPGASRSPYGAPGSVELPDAHAEGSRGPRSGPNAEMPPPKVEADALGRACPPSQRAALERLRQTGNERGCPGLRAAGLDGAPWTALALALWEQCVPFEPRLSRETSAQLERSMAQLDRLWGRADAVDALAVKIEALAPHGVDHHTGEEVRTLRWVVLILKQQGRQARRHARRRPPPRPWKPRGRA